MSSSWKQPALKAQDLLIVLKISISSPAELTFARLSADLHMSASEAHAAVKRATQSRLLAQSEGFLTVNRVALREFIVHGVQYTFPPLLGGLARGVPTGVSAAPLNAMFDMQGDLPHVWPDPEGGVRGISLCPLYPSVPAATASDPRLYELLSLIDALRAGAAREREMAIKALTEEYL